MTLRARGTVVVFTSLGMASCIPQTSSSIWPEDSHGVELESSSKFLNAYLSYYSPYELVNLRATAPSLLRELDPAYLVRSPAGGLLVWSYRDSNLHATVGDIHEVDIYKVADTTRGIRNVTWTRKRVRKQARAAIVNGVIFNYERWVETFVGEVEETLDEDFYVWCRSRRKTEAAEDTMTQRWIVHVNRDRVEGH